MTRFAGGPDDPERLMPGKPFTAQELTPEPALANADGKWRLLNRGCKGPRFGCPEPFAIEVGSCSEHLVQRHAAPAIAPGDIRGESDTG